MRENISVSGMRYLLFNQRVTADLTFGNERPLLRSSPLSRAAKTAAFQPGILSERSLCLDVVVERRLKPIFAEAKIINTRKTHNWARFGG